MKALFSWTDPVSRLPGVQLSRFVCAGGVEEMHLTVQPLREGTDAEQLEELLDAYRETLQSVGWDPHTAVLRRFFCSDLSSQAPALAAHPWSDPRSAADACAVSWVEQAPLPPARMALWAYHVRDPRGELDKQWDGRTLTLRRDRYTHHWTPGLRCPEPEMTYDQTCGVFGAYERLLAARGLSLDDHVIRTWLYIRDIDDHYLGMADARRDLFAEKGLTPQSHYISSTGIEGACEDPRAKVLMDAYAVSGLHPEQIQFLKALDHLSPTHHYGVTFERGTAVTYPDRTHITISGTASIDAEGQILHVGDLPSQLDRTLENIEALLREAGAGLDAMQVFTVYLRPPRPAEAAQAGPAQ